MEMDPETEFNVKEDSKLLENGYVLVSIGHWETQEFRLKRLGFKIPLWQTTMEIVSLMPEPHSKIYVWYRCEALSSLPLGMPMIYEVPQMHDKTRTLLVKAHDNNYPGQSPDSSAWTMRFLRAWTAPSPSWECAGLSYGYNHWEETCFAEDECFGGRDSHIGAFAYCQTT